MAELANCVRCEAVFVKTIRDICESCYRQEEKDFETVYNFLKQRKNREATLQEIVKATEVDEEIIIKFIKTNRLRTSQFPKLAYPCEKCGTPIVSGKICAPCSDKLLADLKYSEENKKMSEQQNKKSNVYYTFNKGKK
ncbi:hypothetical protein KQI49_13305 [Virgibacillus sp. MSJ-26]|uniref:TIGR03826 family flagellar region protein n=1 Tax=Virgibacillus sp. MSJ-26 TaxID=2841522 RepID=UPI001C12380F|nr:TIGR03826 family flagellar region protein [Virgibacillus sp. MSJ-26]MBU5467800.1 hypothetical protein [Virgibacillus sp. MSJ-26]